MKTHHPLFDYEREYLFNDILVHEKEESEYENLRKSSDINIINAKIEIGDARKSEPTNQEKSLDNKKVTGTHNGF